MRKTWSIENRVATVATFLLTLAVLALPACGQSADGADAGDEAAMQSSSEQPASDLPPSDLPPGPAAWDRVVRQHVVDGGIDYAAVQADRGDLDAYLDYLRGADPAAMSDGEAIAFWSNAYNAVVVHFVLQRYPGIESVRAVDGFFDEFTFPVGGREMTLDQIEGEARELDERTHFTVVCASTSCPDLRAEAYAAGRIQAQLEEQTESFLADTSKGLRYDADDNRLWLSSIFKWYAGDFTGGSTVVAFFARGGVREWVVEHLGDRDLARTIEQREPGIKYLDYDWGLNDR